MSRFSWFWVVVIALALAAYWRHQHSIEVQDRAAADPYGFVQVFMPDGAPNDVVLVFAPDNCPHEDARRAVRLLDALRDEGVPARLQTSWQLSAVPQGADAELRLRRFNNVMFGALPAVLIGGMGKANPTSDEVTLPLESVSHNRVHKLASLD